MSESKRTVIDEGVNARASPPDPIHQLRRETTLLKREGGSASGERGKWYIRGGNHVTLAELFDYGCHSCSCHCLYTLYLRQPIFVARKRRSESKTPEAMLMRNAHRLHHHETGKWALPRDPW